jgi:hypothetical protein
MDTLLTLIIALGGIATGHLGSLGRQTSGAGLPSRTGA